MITRNNVTVPRLLAEIVRMRPRHKDLIKRLATNKSPSALQSVNHSTKLKRTNSELFFNIEAYLMVPIVLKSVSAMVVISNPKLSFECTCGHGFEEDNLVGEVFCRYREIIFTLLEEEGTTGHSDLAGIQLDSEVWNVPIDDVLRHFTASTE